MKYPKHDITWISAIIFSLVVIGVSFLVFENVTKNRRKCYTCGDPMWREGVQVRDIWVHKEHFNYAIVKTADIYDNEWSADRYSCIYNMLKRRDIK